MLTLTNPAAARLNSMLSDSTKDREAVIRMIRRDGRFKFRVDSVRRGDITFSFEERVVLALDSAVANRVAARTLGLREIEGKPRLKFSRS